MSRANSEMRARRDLLDREVDAVGQFRIGLHPKSP